MKCNIIGKGYGWQAAPAISDQFDTWGITQLMLERPVDLVIDMNVYADLRWGEIERDENDEVKARCEKENVPYVGLENYPIEDIINFFKTDYFSNTVDYAIALAIYKGYKEIKLYGVIMAFGSEYAYQKPGVDFWCGMAKGKGVDVKVHGLRSSIMKTKDGLLYGYDFHQSVV